ncbi:MAG TPA: hypothetical protein PKL60_06100 [Anaerolineaceae bacterium]|jgi:uncharacterized protein YfaT (DUF1175 family)|nr:hypothetical protein [Anaerolineaceae bacterium]
MIVKAWNNGERSSDGNGYGVKLSVRDRDRYFIPSWKTVSIELEGNPDSIAVNVDKPSFWNKTCRELIHKEIGKWLIKNGLSDWPPYHPPALELQVINERKFFLKLPTSK